MPSSPSISADKLARLIATPRAPVVVAARCYAPGAVQRDHRAS